MEKLPISAKGFEKLRARLTRLKEVERPSVIEAVQRARDLGDLSENADYKTAKDAQRQIDSEIRRLENIMNSANVIDVSALSGETVMFGASVVAADENGREVRYRILSEYESDPAENIIAITSPLARGFIGKRRGDVCVVRAPAGEKEYEIISVEYPHGD